MVWAILSVMDEEPGGKQVMAFAACCDCLPIGLLAGRHAGQPEAAVAAAL